MIPLTALAIPLLLVPAHSFYDPSCCGGQDCAPVADGAVTEDPDGYHFEDMTIPYSDPLIKVSPDDQFHICRPVWPHSQSPALHWPVRCLYTPRHST